MLSDRETEHTCYWEVYIKSVPMNTSYSHWLQSEGMGWWGPGVATFYKYYYCFPLHIMWWLWGLTNACTWVSSRSGEIWCLLYHFWIVFVTMLKSVLLIKMYYIINWFVLVLFSVSEAGDVSSRNPVYIFSALTRPGRNLTAKHDLMRATAFLEIYFMEHMCTCREIDQ